MSKLSKIAATAAVLPVLAFTAPVFADSPGSLAGGSDIYQVRNTKVNSWSSSASAACNETLKYSVKLSNTDFGQLTNVTVKASLTSGQMTATATTSAGGTTSTSGTVSVSLPSGASLSYDTNFGTVVRATDGSTIKTLSDGVTTSGVNAGTLAGSTTEFLQFQANVKCETQVKQIQVCELSTKKVITINEDQFDSSKHSKDLTKCQTTPPTTPPTTLVNTGAGSVAGVAVAIAAVSAVAYNVVSRRRAARQ